MKGLDLFVLLGILSSSNAYIWEKSEDPFSKYQIIPPIKVTSDKMAHFFMGVPTSFNSGRERRGPGSIKGGNVVFVIDSSSSVGKRQFHHELQAIHTVIKHSQDNNKYAVILFSTDAVIKVNFTDRHTAMKKINRIRYTPGMTNIQRGLELARELFLKEPWPGYTSSPPNKVLLITDGLSNIKPELTLYRSFQLKMMGVQIYVIATGRFLHGAPESVGLASTPFRHFFRVYNMKAFLKVARILPIVTRTAQLPPKHV